MPTLAVEFGGVKFVDIKTAMVCNIDEKGTNLKNDSIDGDKYVVEESADTCVENVNFTDNLVHIKGIFMGKPYDVYGKFSAISENGALLAYTAEDAEGNFRVAFCAAERIVSETGRYFRAS